MAMSTYMRVVTLATLNESSKEIATARIPIRPAIVLPEANLRYLKRCFMCNGIAILFCKPGFVAYRELCQVTISSSSPESMVIFGGFLSNPFRLLLISILAVL